MNQETKTHSAGSVQACQNCNQDFVIEAEDFAFYEKIKVPPPTFCPDCRLQRRFSFRNERALYKRTCDLCRRSIVAMYPSGTEFPVYCNDCWWSAKWDASAYSAEYDFSKPFFLQYFDLLKKVPKLNFFQRNTVNSEYGNFVHETKSSYLCFSTVETEDSLYSRATDKVGYVVDGFGVADSQYCYENIDCEKNYNSHFMIRSRNCIGSLFLIDCVNCKNCILSSNLRNKEFVIQNVQYTKEEYLKKKASFDVGKYNSLQVILEDFKTVKEKALYRYASIFQSSRSSGDNLNHAKDSRLCFDAHEIENVSYLVRGYFLKDSQDVNFTVYSELIYEYISGGRDDYNILFTIAAKSDMKNTQYTEYCASLQNCFASNGLHNKQYCILNKQYTKEEYEDLVPKIIQHMNDMPYTDKKGRVYRYGEFFPSELSPFAYNETIAQEYFPLTKEQALEQGYNWKDPESRSYHIDVKPEDLPDHIKEADDYIIGKVIECAHKGECNEQCVTAFKIIPQEFQFYKKMNLPLPRLCPNCRHYQRLKQKNPLKLWHRRCLCDYQVYKNTANHVHHSEGQCPNEFETSYAPDRPEIVYCEQCYQQEVV